MSDFCDDQCRFRCRGKMGRKLAAAHAHETASILLHFAIVREPVANGFEHLRRSRVPRFDNAIVHPFTLAPGIDDSGLSQVSEVPRDFRLRCLQDFHEEADAHFVVSHEIQQAEASSIREGAKQQFEIKAFFRVAHGQILAR